MGGADMQSLCAMGHTGPCVSSRAASTPLVERWLTSCSPAVQVLRGVHRRVDEVELSVHTVCTRRSCGNTSSGWYCGSRPGVPYHCRRVRCCWRSVARFTLGDAAHNHSPRWPRVVVVAAVVASACARCFLVSRSLKQKQRQQAAAAAAGTMVTAVPSTKPSTHQRTQPPPDDDISDGGGVRVGVSRVVSLSQVATGPDSGGTVHPMPLSVASPPRKSLHHAVSFNEFNEDAHQATTLKQAVNQLKLVLSFLQVCAPSAMCCKAPASPT